MIFHLCRARGVDPLASTNVATLQVKTFYLSVFKRAFLTFSKLPPPKNATVKSSEMEPEVLERTVSVKTDLDQVRTREESLLYFINL